MAVQRARPYSQFNFMVQIGNDNGQGVNAGFQEVSGLGVEIHVAEYRAGNWSDNSPIKVNGSYKVPDVTLKRGLIAELTLLHAWLKAVRDGGNDASVLLPVVINLMSEDRTTAVQTWTLTNARPMKYTGPSLTGKGTDVAIEELVLASEHIEIS
ncbi:phage tail-like protein [Edaphobacter aggregans]|uniref:Phage tail-like protein n=1 Tax=Edaphobacter aggregans TaxID=570835 RepID=A0A428MMA6_9BACT|nr:phage tail protein [Edaphobacter aggregans]RSL17980.1 phage tail-like protein [Edaphobacter aggregans]